VYVRFLVSAAIFVTFFAAPVWSQSSSNTIASGRAETAVVPGPLDGKQFKAGIVRAGADEGQKKPLGDLLIFSNGTFSSAVCKKYNFAKAPYWVRVEGSKTHFLAELTSPTDGKMVWKGIVENGKLQGTMHWTKKRWYWTVDAKHKIRGRLDSGSAAPGAPAN
jgi:hypothetical protein